MLKNERPANKVHLSSLKSCKVRGGVNQLLWEATTACKIWNLLSRVCHTVGFMSHCKLNILSTWELSAVASSADQNSEHLRELPIPSRKNLMSTCFIIGWKSFTGVNKWQHYPETGLATSTQVSIVPGAEGSVWQGMAFAIPWFCCNAIPWFCCKTPQIFLFHGCISTLVAMTACPSYKLMSEMRRK